MRKLILLTILLLLSTSNAQAILIDITDSSLPHFGDFPNVNYPGDYSKISGAFVTDPNSRDFGWHYSPSFGPSISGILFPSNSYVVQTLRFQVHSSPFRDFLLQGSNDTTDGFNGSWDTLLSSTVTHGIEQDVQSWTINNSNSYSAFRINALNDYQGQPPFFPNGWAMYRWELLADDGRQVIPEPATLILFGSGLFAAALRKKGIK